MMARVKKLLATVLCAAVLLPLLFVTGNAQPALIADFNTLMTAVQNAKDGDTLLVGDIDFSPLSADVPNSVMYITVTKSLTIKSGKADGAAVFLNGGFVLSGSKSTGEKISVRFENIIFDGKAAYDTLTEKDYQYPWSEAEQTYTYYASVKAQQALSFMGNVDGDFYGCVFRNYMHEYGPVIDIRYADYTGNEYINLPDYSGCSINLNFDACRFEKNSALYDGGAIYIEANNNVSLNANACVFQDNRSTNGQFSRGGGAIYAEGAALGFTGCTFERNVANHMYPDTVLPEYDTHRGGALLLQSADLKMVNTQVLENRASMGGAICFTNTAADIDGCRFAMNRAQAQAVDPDKMTGPWSNMSQGGAMYIEGNSNDTIVLINCHIQDNFAENAYGGLYGYYVPFEDPSLPTYNIKMQLCTYEGNRDGGSYDYTQAGDLLWLSHPGDMFANPHLSLFGCYIADETFASDFPRSQMPASDNGYTYIGAEVQEDLRAFPIPDGEMTAIGERYGDKLKSFHIGSNYAASIYEEDSGPEEKPLDWVIWCVPGLALVLAAVAFVLCRQRKTAPAGKHAAVTEAATASEKRVVIMTRYDDVQIDRFIALVPQTGTLTARELEVLREALRGKKQSEVAYYLGIGVTTVKDFYRKIYTKLNVDNKEGLFILVDQVLKQE